jgi:hypothetical protein
MPSYTIEYHRVWIHTVEAESAKQAREIVEDNMSEDPDAEDYNYSVVKKAIKKVTHSPVNKSVEI